MFNINKWVCGLDFRRFPGPVFDPPRRVFSVIYPNEFCFCFFTCCNETENNLNGSIRKDTGHLSGFLSRAMANSWNVKMMWEGGGIEVNPLGFFLSVLSGVFSLRSSPFQKPWKLFFYVWDPFCIWIWWKINDKRGVVLQIKVLILKLMGSTVPILFIFFHILQFPMKFVSKCSFNKPKLHFLDGGLQLVVLMP